MLRSDAAGGTLDRIAKQELTHGIVCILACWNPSIGQGQKLLYQYLSLVLENLGKRDKDGIEDQTWM